MRKETGKCISLLTPLLLHQALMLAAALLFRICAEQFGLPYSETLAVLAGNLLVLPFAARMYRKDGAGAAAVKKISVLLFGIICFAAGGVLNIAWSSILNLFQIQAHFSNQVQEQLLSANLIVQIIGLGIVAPITEELIFRGLTYRRMRQLFPVWAAVFLSALLFAVYHGNPIQMLFSFPMAVVLALVYEHGKLFLFPVLFHMGSNLTAIFLQILL